MERWKWLLASRGIGEESNTNDFQLKELCLRLMGADSEDEVARILSEAGFWDNPAYWR
ncbi:MAG: hypothetical protein RMI91_12090 [Gemmatales bacterium]|nr:hypothetical protein [Gemmatales bacterium]MDW7995381.1 hypothetical protein [Gemmatales bacterium]